MHEAVLLPGSVLPKDLAHGALIEAFSEDVRAHAKDLEVYATEEPPPEYGLELEVDGVLRAADAAGFDRFHLVGYSGGGAIAAVVAARHPERLLSLTLLEPAWLGNEGLGPEERQAWSEMERVREAPPDEMMPRFIRLQLARMAQRADRLFTTFTLEVWEGRHHFDPPHRAEPERLAARLEGGWNRAP